MSLSISDIVEAFRASGIMRGDMLMLHADAIAVAQLPPMSAEQRFEALASALDEVLGPEGTLVIPTFTYSFTKDEAFDSAATPSTVGALTEYFRGLPGFRRSSDPIFSVAARGRLADEIAALPVGDCFGPGSVFGLLHRENAWLACLGCGFDRITYVHFVEQQVSVDYRYFKTFAGELLRDGRRVAAETRYYVRDLARETDIDLTGFRERLISRGLLTLVPVGRIGLYALPCRLFDEQAREMLRERPNALIAEGRA